MKTITVPNEGLIRRAKTAIMTNATNRDQYRIGADWYSVRTDWTPSQIVEEVRHFGQFTTHTGDLLPVRDLMGSILIQVQVIDITMVNASELTDEQIDALGYSSRPAFEVEWGDMFPGKAWLMQIERITASRTQSDAIQ